MSKLHRNQQGLVSVTVTLVIMIIITLVVSSFALVVRREQRRALDRQLSSQAFYAAEAGIADAQAAMTDTPPLTADIKECTGPGSFQDQVTIAGGATYNSTIDQNIQYSCVLINQHPKSWKKTGANPEDGAFIVPINTGNIIDSLRISWQNASGVPTFEDNATYALPQGGSTLSAPMLKISLMPGFSGGLDRSTLNNRTQTMFLYPNSNSASGNAGSVQYLGDTGDISPAAPEQGIFVSGNCNPGNDGTTDIASKPAPHACNVDITGLNRDNYYLVVQPMYQAASVDVQGFTGGAAQALENSQAEIDVTGKSADVLRRIRVTVPIGEGLQLSDFYGIFPDAAISTTESICKQFEVTNNTYRDNCPGGTWGPLTSATPDPPPPGGDPGGTGDGNALIGSWPPSTGSGPGTPEFSFDFVFKNDSQNTAGVVTGCTWNFGDGSPLVRLPAGQCEYNDTIRHSFTDTSSTIIRTNGADGCYIYTVTLIMHFNGLPDKPDTDLAYVPSGLADDRPDGICYNKFKLR